MGFFGDFFGVAGGPANPPPNVPTLAATDSQDGSHATATVTGSTAGSTNTISVQLLTGNTWSSAGSRVGDGTVNLTLAKGYYWAKCDSVIAGPQSAVSNVVLLPITDLNDSVHARAADAIQAAIISLALPEVGNRVYVQTLPDENQISFPCVSIWFNDAEKILGGTNARDDIGYPVHVAWLNRKLDNLGAKPSRYLLSRQTVARKIRNQILASVPEVYTVEWEPSKVVDEKLPAYNYFVGAMTFICVSREVRG